MSKRILELDGLRAFAVAAVILFHLAKYALSDIVPEALQPAIATLGSGGVSVFFIISGFIITTLLLKEHAKTGGVNLTGFYIRRFFRIIPPLAAFLLVLLVLNQIGYIDFPRKYAAYALLFLGNLDLYGHAGHGSFWFFAHTWSLAVEEQFYLFFPPLLVLAFVFRRKPMALFLVAFFLLSWASMHISQLLKPLNGDLVKFRALYSFRFIVTGVLLALYRKQVTQYLANTSFLVPVAALGLVLFMNLAPIPRLVGVALDLVKPIAFGVFTLWFVENPDKSAALRWNWIQWVGGCSYSLYLWQQLFTGDAHYYNGPAPSALVAVIGTFACAAGSYYLVEKPTIRLGRYFSDKASKRAVPDDTVAANPV